MKNTRNWLLVFTVLAGLVFGGFLGEFFGGYPALSWLNYGKQFGINADSPMIINFYIFRLTFGFMIKVNIASVIGVAVALLIYKLLKK